jgi:hypothetical protein
VPFGDPRQVDLGGGGELRQMLLVGAQFFGGGLGARGDAGQRFGRALGSCIFNWNICWTERDMACDKSLKNATWASMCERTAGLTDCGNGYMRYL